MSALFAILLKVVRLTPRAAMVIFVAGVTFLIIPEKWASKLAVDEFRVAHRQLIGPVTFVAFIVILSAAVIWIGKFIRDDRSRKKKRTKTLASISTLHGEEHWVLAYFMHQNAKTVYLVEGYPPAQSLVEKGLLVHGGKPAGTNSGSPYTLPDFVWKYLNENRADLFDYIDDPRIQEILINFSHFQDCFYGRVV